MCITLNLYFEKSFFSDVLPDFPLIIYILIKFWDKTQY